MSIVFEIIVAFIIITFAVYGIATFVTDVTEEIQNASSRRKNTKLSTDYDRPILTREEWAEGQMARESEPIRVLCNGRSQPLYARFTKPYNGNMTDYERQRLTVGESYAVDSIDIGRCHTNIGLMGVGGGFNSVNFDLVAEDGTKVEICDFENLGLAKYYSGPRYLA